MRGFASIRRVLVLSIVFLLLLSLSYCVVQVHGSEPSLIEIFNYLGFTNVIETTVGTFTAGTYNITLYAEFAGYCDENELSYYEVNTSIFNVIFTGPEGGSGYISPPTTKTFMADYQFGLSLFSDGYRYFSEASKNPNGRQYAKVYKNLDDPNMFLIGFDERSYCDGTGDGDYNDMVFSLECAHDLTVSAGVGGSTDPVPGVYSHPYGSSVDITAIPEAGYRLDHWVLDGSPAGSANPISVLMNDNHDLEAVFAETHMLIIIVSEGGSTDPAPGTYTYETPTNVVVEAIPFTDYLFDHWEFDDVDIGSDNPITVYVGSTHTLKAVFVYSPPPPPLSVSISPLSRTNVIGDSVSFTSTVSGGTSPYSHQWYLDDAPVSGATSSSWTFTPTSTGIYYVYLKITDANSNIAQSETATITVSAVAVPVGGYSVSLTQPTETTPLIGYTMILAIFGAVLTLFRRKRK